MRKTKKGYLSAQRIKGTSIRHPAYTKDYEQFLVKLRNARKEAGMTQIDAAQAFGVEQSIVSHMESGKRRVDVLELHYIAKVYKKPLSYFEPSS